MDEGRRKRDAVGVVNAEVLHSRGAPRLVSALLTPAVLPIRSQTLATSGTGATAGRAPDEPGYLRFLLFTRIGGRARLFTN